MNGRPKKESERFSTLCIGGGFLFGMPPSAPKFYRYIQENLEKRGKKVGLAILNYSV